MALATSQFWNGSAKDVEEQAGGPLQAHFEMNMTPKEIEKRLNESSEYVEKFPLRADARIHDFRPNLEISPDLKILDKTFPFENRGGFLGKDNNQIFRVPILRNITKTAPYFHNGAIKNIEEAVEIMGKHQLGINFTKDEIEEIVEFLKTLEGELVDYKIAD